MTEEMRGHVAIWVPDGVITAEEMGQARPAFDAAIAQHKDTVVITINDERVITCKRVIITLPIFIESASAEQAEGLARALTERAERGRMN